MENLLEESLDFGLIIKNNCPNKLEKIIKPKFNRAILFDTTQNSWHGLVNPVNTKKNIFRKSLAIYYLSNLAKYTNTRSKHYSHQLKNSEEIKRLFI